MQLHNHSPEQQQVLDAQLNEVIHRLLTVSFENPANDQQMIRHHAYLRGKYDTLVAIRMDNYEAPEPIQPSEE